MISSIILLLALTQAPYRSQNKTTTVASTSFRTSYSGGTDLNIFGGWIGAKITMGGTGKTVTSLGRYCVSGNSASHTLHVADSSFATLASCSVNMSGCTGGVTTYCTVSQALSASTVYYIMSEEINGGDHWIANDSTITTTGVATSESCYGAINASCTVNGGDPTTYGPMDWKYN